MHEATCKGKQEAKEATETVTLPPGVTLSSLLAMLAKQGKSRKEASKATDPMHRTMILQLVTLSRGKGTRERFWAWFNGTIPGAGWPKLRRWGATSPTLPRCVEECRDVPEQDWSRIRTLLAKGTIEPADVPFPETISECVEAEIEQIRASWEARSADRKAAPTRSASTTKAPTANIFDAE
jgi:hypothetical protein